MIPRQAGLGKSFKGAGAYYLHDKEARTSERVAFTHTENIPTQDPDKALKWMAWTAIHADELKRASGSSTGQRCTKPVFTFSLAWHPEQDPHKWEMVGAGPRALIALGLQDHETLVVGHSDTDHPHVHLIVNTINPDTGRVNTLKFSKLKLSKWAEEYEREHGKIYCDQRVENNEQREQGKFAKYLEPALDHKSRITQLYHASDSGKAFQEALAEAGYRLAQRKRIVVIDQEGKIHSLSRQIEGVKAKDIRAKLADLQLQAVDEERGKTGTQAGKPENKPNHEAEEQEQETHDAQGRQRENSEPEYIDRDQQDRDWQESIIDAAIKGGETRKRRPQTRAPQQSVPPIVLNALQDRHLAELGSLYDENHRAKLQLASQLEESYGVHERELRRDTAHLEQMLNNSGRFRVWWLKLTGQIPETAEQDLQNMRLTLENIDWRKSEAQQALNTEILKCRQEIESRQNRERVELRPEKPGFAYESDQLPDEFDEQPEADEDFGPSLGY